MRLEDMRPWKDFFFEAFRMILSTLLYCVCGIAIAFTIIIVLKLLSLTVR
jgi:hypothetical protein